MQIYRCLICGDTFVMNDKPKNCPYCGSDEQYIVLTVNYPDGLNDVDLTEQERADLLRSASLEFTNTTFYAEIGKTLPKDSALSSLYRHLAKIEKEHLSVFSKLLGAPVDELDFEREYVEPAATWKENIQLSTEQEVEASDFYRAAAERATSPRVKQVLTAIAQVEETHIDVDKLALELAD